MNKRRMAAAFCLVALATSAFALSSDPRRLTSFIGISAGGSDEAQEFEGERAGRSPARLRRSARAGGSGFSDPQAPVAPEHVVYGLLFREVVTFKRLAREKELKGQDGAFLRGHHRGRLRLNDASDEALARIADETERDVRKLDGQARKIIERERARHPEGKLKEGEALPVPPEELGALQRQRDARVLKGRDDLRAALGEEEFNRFDEFVRRDVTSKMRPVQQDRHPEPPSHDN